MIIILIDSYNNDASHSTHTTAYLFTKHSLFDLAVNNSPAYHAFDQDATTEWVSHSNRYDVTTGDAFQTGFSGTPPATISINSGSWSSTGWYYNRTSYTSTSVLYDISFGANYAIVFSINANNDLELDVNDPTHGTNQPSSFKINGSANHLFL